MNRNIQKNTQNIRKASFQEVRRQNTIFFDNGIDSFDNQSEHGGESTRNATMRQIWRQKDGMTTAYSKTSQSFRCLYTKSRDKRIMIFSLCTNALSHSTKFPGTTFRISISIWCNLKAYWNRSLYIPVFTTAYRSLYPLIDKLHSFLKIWNWTFPSGFEGMSANISIVCMYSCFNFFWLTTSRIKRKLMSICLFRLLIDSFLHNW